MLESLVLVSKQVGVLFALMAVGFLCNRRRLLDDAAIKGVTKLLVVVVTPCVIIHSFIRQTFAPSLLGDLGWALAVSVFAHAAGTALAFLCLRDRNPNREGVLRFAVIFSNAGFMGIPLEYALLGTAGVFFGAMYVVVFNLACWSLGVAVMCRGVKNVGLRSLLVNPGTAGVALGLPFFLFSLELPEVIGRPLEMMADLNTPLAMIMVGWYLAESCKVSVVSCKLKVESRKGPSLSTSNVQLSTHNSQLTTAIVAVLRLVVVPFVVIGALAGVRAVAPAFNPVMAVAVSTAAAAPVAALTTVVAALYEKDVATATRIVSGTTLLSILTMPPVVGFALWLFAPSW